jgi:hypothetical protein
MSEPTIERDNAQLINQSSGDVEIFTPRPIIRAATEALGGFIHLDPASCEAANEIVGATAYFTKEDDGLSQSWKCETLWMNHPFSRKENALWINKFLMEYQKGHFHAGCCITFASTSEAWFVPLMRFPQCFLHPRTNYLRPDGTIYRGVTKGSVITYLGNDLPAFREAFKQLGTVKV